MLRSVCSVIVFFVATTVGLAQSSGKPPKGNSTYQEGTTTTGKCEVYGDGATADISFSDSRATEALTYTMSSTGNLSYYRVSRAIPGGGWLTSNDFYEFTVSPEDPKVWTWKKYWCQGFLPNGKPWGKILTATGSLTYP